MNKAVDYSPSSLVWSSDGTTIGIVYQTKTGDAWDVHIYHIASGGSVSIPKIPSNPNHASGHIMALFRS